MKRISSKDNPIYKKLVSLQQRKTREKEDLYLIEGFNLCKEAMSSMVEFEFLIVKDYLYETAQEEELQTFLSEAEKKRISTFIFSDVLFDKIAQTESPKGMAAVVKIKRWKKDAFVKGFVNQGGNLLIMDRIQDPGNAGTLIRTAEASGFKGLIAVKGTVDLYSPKVIRSTAGSIFRIPILSIDSPEEVFEIAEAGGIKIAVASPRTDSFYFEQELIGNIGLVIGNEGGGVQKLFLEKADCHIKIPMAQKVESLNAAVAGGILMYEIVRQNFQRKTEE